MFFFAVDLCLLFSSLGEEVKQSLWRLQVLWSNLEAAMCLVHVLRLSWNNPFGLPPGLQLKDELSWLPSAHQFTAGTFLWPHWAAGPTLPDWRSARRHYLRTNRTSGSIPHPTGSPSNRWACINRAAFIKSQPIAARRWGPARKPGQLVFCGVFLSWCWAGFSYQCARMLLSLWLSFIFERRGF